MVTLRATYIRLAQVVGYAVAQFVSANTRTRTTEDGRQEHQAYCVVRNTGDAGEDFEIRYYNATAGRPNPATDVSLEAHSRFINAGDVVSDSMSGWHLVSTVGIFGIWAWPTSTFPGAPDFNTYAAYIEIVSVNTTLTVGISPSKFKGGTPITVSGRLTRNDTGAGVDGQTIYLKAWLGTDPTAPPPATQIDYGTAITSGGGNYSKQVTAPVAGRYIFDATFLGVGGLGMSVARIGVESLAVVEEGIIPLNFMILMADLLALVGIGVGNTLRP